MRKTTIVVPCFNEEHRLPVDQWTRFSRDNDVTLLFVDDGSTDNTRTVIRALASDMAGMCDVLELDRNRGKGEAVRRGMAAAIKSGADITGYADADMATRSDDLRRLLDLLTTRVDVEVVVGARVQLLGRSVRRSFGRHIIGRIFATFASLILKLPIYDTQCGAKVFMATPPLLAVLEETFAGRWAFDVELLGRIAIEMRAGGHDPAKHIVEEPLMAWHDAQGSRLGIIAMLRAGCDLILIWWRLRQRL